MMTLGEQMELDRQDAFEEGKAKGKLEIAKNLKDAGLALSLIAENTGLPIEEVEAL